MTHTVRYAIEQQTYNFIVIRNGLTNKKKTRSLYFEYVQTSQIFILHSIHYAIFQDNRQTNAFHPYALLLALSAMYDRRLDLRHTFSKLDVQMSVAVKTGSNQQNSVNMVLCSGRLKRVGLYKRCMLNHLNKIIQIVKKKF